MTSDECTATSPHRVPEGETIVNERPQLLLAIAAIVVSAAAAVWLVSLPNDPKLALGDSAAAALIATIILLAKVRRDHWQK
jgi:peptidoglycan/LPS O-acetylase OafA/YrhL